MCDKMFYEPLKNGCIPPAKSCPDCRKYFDRAQCVKSRVEGDVDYKFIRQLLDRDTCEYCGKKLSWEEREIEHKIPVNKGGNNNNTNLCISCVQCNHEKGDMTYDEYMEFRKSLMFTSSERKFILDMISRHNLLYKTEYVDEFIEERDSDEPIVKNKTIKDVKGKATGLRKVFVYTSTMKISRKVVETRLTDWGKMYNIMCRAFNKKQLKKSTEYEILDAVPVNVDEEVEGVSFYLRQ